MKSFVPYTLLAAFAACGLAMGQSASTTPVGYVTKNLLPGTFTLVGLTLHQPTISAGVIASATPTSVTVTGADFTSLLTAGEVYLLELPDGTVQEITSFAGDTLTTPENISGNIVGGTTTFVVRKASTVTDIFGATNSLGLTASADGDSSSADKILLLQSNGAFKTVYYVDDGAGTQGWFDDQFGDASKAAIAYPDGFFVQRLAGSQSLPLIVSGEVKLKPTSNVVSPGFNYLSAVSPVGLTLEGSGMSTSVTQSADGDISTVDNVLVQNADGTYSTFFYINAPDLGVTGWFDDQNGAADDFVIDSGFLVFNRSVVKSLTVNTPSYYSSL